jgi:hypothetical protein
MTKRSNIAIPCPAHPRACCVLIFWTTTAICLLSAARPSRAAGCHAHDRPVLNHTLSWEPDQNIQFETARIAQPPPVLTHPRCGDEIPLASGSSTLSAVSALLAASNFSLPDFYEPLLGHARREHSQPTAIRLDRPPRA